MLTNLNRDRQPEGLDLLCALELTLHGAISHKLLIKASDLFNKQLPDFTIEGIKDTGSVVVREDYLVQELKHLRSELHNRVKRNPLIDRIYVSDISEIKSSPVPGMALYLLDMLAASAKVQIVDTRLPGGAYIELPQEMFPRNTESDFYMLAKKIYAGFESEKGGSREVLRRRHNSDLNVVAALFDAGWLIESPDGFVFTRERLENYLSRLNQENENIGSFSIKDIKNLLGIKSKEAEGLHNIVQRSENNHADNLSKAEPKNG
jgi:hypothetical protein